jgi:hypothetical protein
MMITLRPTMCYDERATDEGGRARGVTPTRRDCGGIAEGLRRDEIAEGLRR